METRINASLPFQQSVFHALFQIQCICMQCIQCIICKMLKTRPDKSFCTEYAVTHISQHLFGFLEIPFSRWNILRKTFKILPAAQTETEGLTLEKISSTFLCTFLNSFLPIYESAARVLVEPRRIAGLSCLPATNRDITKNRIIYNHTECMPHRMGRLSI